MRFAGGYLVLAGGIRADIFEFAATEREAVYAEYAAPGYVTRKAEDWSRVRLRLGIADDLLRYLPVIGRKKHPVEEALEPGQRWRMVVGEGYPGEGVWTRTSSVIEVEYDPSRAMTVFTVEQGISWDHLPESFIKGQGEKSMPNNNRWDWSSSYGGATTSASISGNSTSGSLVTQQPKTDRQWLDAKILEVTRKARLK